MYSPELKELVRIMLVKDEKKRPQVIDILKMPFVQNYMVDFIKGNGKVNINPYLTLKKEIQPATF